MGTVRKRSGPMTVTVWPRSSSSSRVRSSARTTPLTWGYQASETMTMRMERPSRATARLSDNGVRGPTVGINGQALSWPRSVEVERAQPPSGAHVHLIDLFAPQFLQRRMADAGDRVEAIAVGFLIDPEIGAVELRANQFQIDRRAVGVDHLEAPGDVACEGVLQGGIAAQVTGQPRQGRDGVLRVVCEEPMHDLDEARARVQVDRRQRSLGQVR